MRNWARDWDLCEKATCGKWEMVSANCPEGPYMIRMPYPKGGTWYGVRMIAWKEDAEFIAEAREALPYWLQRVRELERAIKSFVEVCELAERTGVWVVMTPVMWEAFEKLKGVVKRDAD